MKRCASLQSWVVGLTMDVSGRIAFYDPRDIITGDEIMLYRYGRKTVGTRRNAAASRHYC